MTNLFFLPFVGHDYSAGGIFGKRVMILGESHYCGEKCADCGVAGKAGDCAAFTTNVIKAYLNPNTERERWMSTYLKFERSLVGHETDGDERQRIWQSLLFFNFLQVAMDETRQAGTQEQYLLPGDGRWREEKDIVIDGQHIATGSYRLGNGGRAKVMAVYHPSVGYSWDWWHKVIHEFLNQH